jgi:CRISPR-associated protein Cas1
MMSLPDFKEKQILLVRAEWGQKCSLRFFNDNIVFRKDGKIVNRASCHKVFAVFVVGDIAITTGLIKDAIKFGISIFLLRNNFETYSTFLSQAEGNYLLRQKQYRMPEADEFFASKKIVQNKIDNQISLVRSTGKWKNTAARRKEMIADQLENIIDNQELLGVEGNNARVFFEEYFDVIGWRRRAPRDREDIPNFLMDIGYTYLFHFVDSLLRLYGFDTYKGMYHKLFFQRRSLACDIMEPFRCIIDKQIRKAYNLKQINEKDFKVEQGKYVLPFENNQKYSQIFMKAIMDNKEEIFNYVREYYRFMMNQENPFPYYQVHVSK